MEFAPSSYSVDSRGVVQLSHHLRSWVDARNGFYRHWLHHEICKHYYQKSAGSSVSGETSQELEARGLSEIPNVLPQDKCDTLCSILDQAAGRRRRPRDVENQKTVEAIWTHKSSTALRQMLPDIITPDACAQLEGYYGCHFQILSLSMTRHFAERNHGDSFLWHRDHEPPQQAHMIAYLSGASENTGTTKLADLRLSRLAALAGYSYPRVEDRKVHLKDVGGGFDINDDGATTVECSAGGAIIFGAPRLLHKAVRPTVGHRDSLLLIFIPSPVPWQERLAENFGTILRHGANFNAGFIDPFDAFSPTRNHGDAPDWARNCDMSPPIDEIRRTDEELQGA